MKASKPKDIPEQPAIDRLPDLVGWMGSKSHFLFGPRQTGKTFLIHRLFSGIQLYDLLDTSIYLALSRNPGLLEEQLSPENKVVVIDEVQRLPELLNEVHRLIEKRRIRFLLTGSSARKLSRGGVNLLGGRARTRYLHPLTYRELGPHFALGKAIARGVLPSIYFSDDPKADLDAYTGTYLQQEILAEGATRNVPAFSRFLHVAALCNATIVNYTNVSNDAQVPRTTVYEYFQILKDTLLLHEVPAWRHSQKRKPLTSSKYYFFDIGVASALQGRLVKQGTPEFGLAFETWILHELLSYRDYLSGEPVNYWRSNSGFEVDFILGDHTAIEIKAKKTITIQDLKSLNALAEEKNLKHFLCVSLEDRARQVGVVRVLPYHLFLDALWDREFTA